MHEKNGLSFPPVQMSDIVVVRSASALKLAWDAACRGEMECRVLLADCVSPCVILESMGLRHCAWNIKTGDTTATWDIVDKDTPTALETSLYKMASGVLAVKARIRAFEAQRKAWKYVSIAIGMSIPTVTIELHPSDDASMPTLWFYVVEQMTECGYHLAERLLGQMTFERPSI